MLSSFFPFSTTKLRVKEKFDIKEILAFDIFIENGKFPSWWSKEKRYVYFLRNPNAVHPIPSSFEGKLNQVVEIITLE